MWEVEYTDEFESWWHDLTQDQQAALDDRVMLLAEPLTEPQTASRWQHHQLRHANMKELRVSAYGALRVLFAFDPRTHAILLIGGDKSGQWNDWYRTAVPEADDLYDEHLNDIDNREGR